MRLKFSVPDHRWTWWVFLLAVLSCAVGRQLQVARQAELPAGFDSGAVFYSDHEAMGEVLERLRLRRAARAAAVGGAGWGGFEKRRSAAVGGSVPSGTVRAESHR